MPRDQVFISYSHQDTKWREDLEKNLKPYLRDGSISSWSDKQIDPGSEWFKQIQSALANSKVAVLLVTPDFLASDFIHEYELGPLLKEGKEGGVTILWVPIYDSAYKETELKNYQAVLDPGKPLGGMTRAKRDRAWVKICEEIKKAVHPSPEPPPPDADPAVSAILSRCYRRALFTRQHAQTTPEAMFASIDACRNIIQANIPLIRGVELQGIAQDLLAVIDAIVRKDPIRSLRDEEDINKLKLMALNAFRKLAARVTGGSYPLPAPGTLAETMYFTREEADHPPDIDEIRRCIRP